MSAVMPRRIDFLPAEARLHPASRFCPGRLEFVDEAGAYAVVLKNAKTLGLTPAQIKDYESRQGAYSGKLLPAASALVKKGNFEAARKQIDPGI